MWQRGFVALFAVVVSAQDSRWQALQQLPEGATLRVRLQTRDEIVVRLRQWEPQRLVLDPSRGGPPAVARSEITRVTRCSRTRGALLGFLVGFGVAFPVGALAGPYIADFGNPPVSTRMRHGAGFGLFFGGVGAGIGVGLGKQVTLYRGTP